MMSENRLSIPAPSSKPQKSEGKSTDPITVNGEASQDGEARNSQGNSQTEHITAIGTLSQPLTEADKERLGISGK